MPEHSIELTNPDFVAFAEACGGMGLRVDAPDALAPALKQALEAEKPVVIDVAVNPDELIMPPKITLSQAANFGLAKLREYFG